MKSNWGTEFAKNLKRNGWVELNGTIKRKSSLTEEEKAQIDIRASKQKHNRSTGLKTAWIDDYRNLRNKEHQKDTFMQLVKLELGLELWPEFFFSVDRQYRLDYAIPIDQNGGILKIAIEQQGGIWLKGNSGHSSGTGIKRDMDKSNLLQSLGWKIIQVEPYQIEREPGQTINLIRNLLIK